MATITNAAMVTPIAIAIVGRAVRKIEIMTERNDPAERRNPLHGGKD